MAINLDISALLTTLGKFTPGKPLDKFITSAVFPNFKNLESGCHITFEYPISVLVGPNGSGKSSILHALWGMPNRFSTSRFWFSTDVDPIAEGGKDGVVRYFYRHWVSALNREVETRKVRGKKRLGYWEPARVSIPDGMQKMPKMTSKDAPFRSADRWSGTQRDVKYINFKCEFSAFDRFFYFPDRGVTLEARQESILNDATKLKKVISRKLSSYKPGGREAVFENRDLNQTELDWISYILGREYTSAQYIQHRLYGHTEAATVVFKRPGIEYSEAFAGSGELAVVRAVLEISSCQNYSLILLDEPETSLHPGAQERLLAFIMEMVKTKFIQVVLSTHSPTIVNMLPASAIKVLDGAETGKTRIIEGSHPSVAFNRLGHNSAGKITVAVEDQLLLRLVEIALSQLDPGERKAIDLYVPPAGAATIFSSTIPTWISDKRMAYVIVDGDQLPKVNVPDVNSLTLPQRKKLASLIKSAFGYEPLHVSDNDEKSGIEYLQWLSDRVGYLNAVCPEQVLLEGLVGTTAASASMNNNKLAKTNLIAELEKQGHQTNAAALNAAVSFIIKDPIKNPYIVHLKGLLQRFLRHHAAHS